MKIVFIGRYMITVSKVHNPGVLSRWIRAHRVLACGSPVVL